MKHVSQWPLAILAVAPSSFFATAYPSSCGKALTPGNNVRPTAASGYTWALVATGLSTPRSLQFDPTNDDVLWVLESGKGVTRHKVVDNGGVCVSLVNSSTVISDNSLNHGLVVTSNHILVSNTNDVYQVSRGPGGASLNSKQMLVTGMDGTDHVTRTLLLEQGTSDSLIVSRGSFDNVDPVAVNASSGHSTIKMFNVGAAAVQSGPHDYDTSGTLLGWGLRNDVGIAQHPGTGGLYSVENSADQVTRNGVDVHENNPGEELNYLGVVNSARTAASAKFYGYPNCFSTWNVTELPANQNLHVGTPFAPSSKNDSYCLHDTQAARITFQAHSAPLDIKFNSSGTQAWVTFHGSWDRDTPTGYGVALLGFGSNGNPTAPSTSLTAANYIFHNVDDNACPDNCFRPVGLSFDKKGRVWITSDATGEIYVLMKK